jgi:hypothetical protein
MASEHRVDNFQPDTTHSQRGCPVFPNPSHRSRFPVNHRADVCKNDIVTAVECQDELLKGRNPLYLSKELIRRVYKEAGFPWKKKPRRFGSIGFRVDLAKI